MKRSLCIVLVLLILLPLTAYGADVSPSVSATPSESPPPVATDSSITGIMSEGLNPPPILAKSAIVVELNSDVTLYDLDSHTARPMASLTKIMTALLCLESSLDLQGEVTAQASAFAGLSPDGSTANIKTGETMTFESLLYCIMVASANEACNIAAEHVAGSVPAFVEMMNAKAKELGCLNTNFTNPHGLHEDGHYSSAYDMYLMIKEAMKYPFFMQLANTLSKAIPPTNMTPTERSLLTTNYLISKATQDGYLYDLALGIKTGHHSNAGYCLASSAKNEGKKMYIVTVVLGSEKTADGITHSFTDTKALMEWSFNAYEFRTILTTKEIITSTKVQMGKELDSVNLNPKNAVTVLVPSILETKNIQRHWTLQADGNIVAPVKKSEQLGELTLAYRNYTFATVPLISDAAVELDEAQHLAQEADQLLHRKELWYVIFAIAGAIILWLIIMIILGLSRRKKREQRGNYKGRKKRRR
ncbi:hypothetical protein FACS1894217_02440 [Clostridia bacterium]|nr:hypothetical protein FACS1894217_02440 [Clostridia bacterium]